MVLYPSADELRRRQRVQPTGGDTTPQRMAVQRQQANNQATPYLTGNQQDLLLAALQSQAQDRQALNTGDSGLRSRATSDVRAPPATMSGNTMFMSPQDATLDNLDYTPELDYLDGDDSFDFDNADLGGEMIGSLPGSGSPDHETQNGHEKRKSRDEGDNSDENDPKRQETQEGAEKGAKKPGRKPLTSEPTTKRKAQNRAAQRAFRERKEKHLKDLETKVTELSKTHEADRHENGLLKAQVDRLQVELREYRKRLSLNSGSGGARGSPPLSAYTGQSRSSTGQSANSNFQFEFPKFGGLPGSQMFGEQNTGNGVNNGVLQRGSITPPITQSPTTINGVSNLPAQVSRADSQHSQNGRSISPATNASRQASNAATPPLSGSFPAVGYSTNNNMHGFASTLPQMNSDNPFGDLFSPSLLKSANFDSSNSYFGNAQQSNSNGANTLTSFDAGNGGESTAGLNRVFQFNGGSSSSDSASPSASSTSQWNANANSSCGTSPEPSHDSPATKAHHNSESYPNDKSNGLRQFSTNSTQSLFGMQSSSGNPNINLTGNSLEYNIPTTDTFDPVLFGDYRDTTENVFGTTNDFGANPFFDDALNTGAFDYSSPSNLFGILQSPQQTQNTLSVNNSAPANAPTPSRNLMAEIDKTRDGGDDDYGLPSTTTQASKPTTTQSQTQNGKLISCNNIWNQLQSNPDFQNGTFDLDSLCSELRAKARCSESGVMVSQDHVDAALKKLGKKDEGSGKFVPATGEPDLPPLMFEQESWDKVLRKLGGTGGR